MGVIKFTTKTKIIKPLLFVLAGIAVGVVVTAVAITRYPLPARIASLVAVKASPTPVAIASPSPLLQLSERALKIAAWAITNSSEKNIKATKIKYNLDESTTNTELIKFLALKWDTDPVRLAEVEAMMEKGKAAENRPVVNVEAPNVNVEAPSTKQTCYTDEIAGSLRTVCR